MKTKPGLLLLATVLGLLLAAVVLIANPVQAALPIRQERALPENGIVYPTGVQTVTSFILSNEAPGRLVLRRP